MKLYGKISFFFLLFLLPKMSLSQAVGDYQAIGTGTWATLGIWQTWNGVAWVAAGATPTSANGVITILNPFNVNIAGAVTIDQVIVNSGATLQTSGAIALTIANGAGIDLQVNGTFIDGSTGVITWNVGSTWQYGATGTLIKTTGNSALNWQNNYSGGASTMPSTAFWISRKIAGSNPAIVTIGAYYPNLTIENNTGAQWVTATTSTFQGNTGFPTIKGNLDIGGAGTNTVDFLNGHTFATPSTIIGNVTVRAGNIVRNYGTGFEIQGSLAVSGTINYDANDARLIRFTGANAQSISGAGTLNVFDMTVNKSANNLTLSRAVTVDNAMTFTSGIVFTSLANLLTINTNGSVASASNSSFVDGPVRYVGNNAFTFPVGKGSYYEPLGYSATAAAGGTFWTETFNNGCVNACTANGVNTGNGAWTIDNSNNPATDNCGQPPQSNVWYVSCKENGNASGACGTGCGANATLHIGSTTVGDGGASFDAGGYCDILGPGWGGGTNTNTMVVSPTISTVGKSNITLSFTYLHYGEVGFDWGWVDYSTNNGATWSTMVNPMPQTICCGGPCDNLHQGQWTTYSTTLPVAAENIAGFKLRFGWRNDDNSTGNDPSFSINDITLSTPATPVDFTCEFFYANPQTPYGNVLVPSLAVISNCEYWILTRNAGTASKNVTLTWNAGTCSVVNVLADLRVARHDGISTWQNEGNTATTGTTAAGTVTSGSVSSFSPFTLGSVTVIGLPIELLQFTANYNGETVDLNWSTASETNNDYFTIERTAGGNTFKEIVRVTGAGTTSIRNDYHTIDPSPLEGVSYYRLKQTDFDGKFSYSSLVPIKIEKENELNIISVNNSNGELESIINCTCQEPLQVEVLDMLGNVLYSETIPAQSNSRNKISISTISFSAGIYLLKIADGSGIRSAKFIL